MKAIIVKDKVRLKGNSRSMELIYNNSISGISSNLGWKDIEQNQVTLVFLTSYARKLLFTKETTTTKSRP